MIKLSGLPKRVQVNEEGPREGFQYEKGHIETKRKIELIDALSETGLSQIQTVSFVNPARVPGWADADVVAAGFRRKPGVRYTCLWLNAQGFERAAATPGLTLNGSISLTASEKFLLRNQRRSLAENIEAQHGMIDLYKRHGVPVTRGSIMAAFGCNFQGDIPESTIVAMVGQILDIGKESGLSISRVSLADTMAWATPKDIYRIVGAVRSKYPELELSLHLHDTRGMAVANAFAGLQMGVASYDSTVAGLGGCPFAAHAGGAGNICTEDLVFMLHEMGIETGIDLEKLLEVAMLAEDIVGHPLPGSLKTGGSLKVLRERVKSAAQS